MHTPDSVASAGAWLLENGHRAILKVTGGRVGHRILGAQSLELHTVGRKSGKAYATLLTTPVHDDEQIVLVASKGGHSIDPDWYKNAIATPEVTVVVNGVGKPMHARTATPEERADLWPRAVKANPGYAGYQRNTDREIPLLILEPR